MSIYDILDWLWYGFTAVVLVPIVAGLLHWRLLNKSERSLVWFLIAMLMLEVVATTLRFNAIRNHFIHYFQTSSVLWIGTHFYTERIGWGNWPMIIAVVVAITIPVEVFGWVGFNHINTATETVAWLLIALYAFVSLVHVLEQPLDRSIRRDGMVYHHAGFLLIGFFKAGRACFLNYFIETSVDLYFFIDTLVVIIGAVVYGLFTIGFTLKER